MALAKWTPPYSPSCCLLAMRGLGEARIIALDLTDADFRLGQLTIARAAHTFCSHLAMRGAPARAIQELTGHADLTTTMRSMHLSPASVNRAIRFLEQPGTVGSSSGAAKA